MQNASEKAVIDIEKLSWATINQKGTVLVIEVREKVDAQLEPNYKHVRIEKAQLRNKAGMLGAAYLASERLKNTKK